MGSAFRNYMCKKSLMLDLCMFLKISRPPELRSTYRLLRWNIVAEPVLLHTINPNSKTKQNLVLSGCQDFFHVKRI